MTQFSEAIKLKDGILYNLEYHQERMNRTVFNFYKKQIDLSRVHEEIPENMLKGFFKFRILYSHKILSLEFIAYSFRTIKTVGIVSDNNIDYSYKYADRQRLNELLTSSKCDDIIIAKNGLITDASSSNLVFESSEGLFTPKSYLLAGTKRQCLLNKALVNEEEITIEDIKNFEKVYFINAMVDLEDHICIDTTSLQYI